MNSMLRNYIMNNKYDARWLRPIAHNGGRYLVLDNGRIDLDTASSNLVPDFIKNATALPMESWKELDGSITKARDKYTALVADLMNEGLSETINDYGAMVYYRQKIGNEGNAVQDMSGLALNPKQESAVDADAVPLPVTYWDFDIDYRTEAMWNRGAYGDGKGSFNINQFQLDLASRKVAEKLEDVAFNGGMTYGGATVYGATTFPDRIDDGDLSANWQTATGAEIVKDVVAMREKLKENKYIGVPFNLYVNPADTVKFETDYDATSKTTIRERIEKINGLKAIRESDFVPEGTSIVLALDKTVVTNIVGAGMQAVTWVDYGGLVNKFKVMTIQSPLWTSDANGKCGLVAYSKP